ncbi:MAG: hypothetical protein D6723_17420 [Acidobacteria bacterium]|nr:MAG: hypothetical protein D6723_17420 [Acidobacteriota bacterium]
MIKTMRHYFKDIFHWLDQIPDWRDPKRIRYRVGELVGAGLTIFLLRLESRRRLNEEQEGGRFDTDASRFFHGRRIAHGDSMNSFLRRLDGESWPPPVAVAQWSEGAPAVPVDHRDQPSWTGGPRVGL